MYLRKIIASLAAGVLLCLNFSAVSYADTVTVTSLANDGVSPAYEIANSCTSNLTIQNGTAECTSIAKGTDAVSITVAQTLQKHWGLWIWNDVEGAEWTRTVDRNSIRLSTTKQDLDKGTYRLKSVFTLTDKDGKSETITIYSNEENLP